MRKLFSEIFLVTAVFASLIYFLEKRYSGYKTQADEMMEKYFQAENGAEVLMVGNSHAMAVYTQLRKFSDKKIALLGLGGLDVFQMRNLALRYASRMKKLKLIILSADEYCLGNNLRLLNFLYVDRMLYPYTDTLYDETTSSLVAAKSNFLRSNRDLKFLFSNGEREPANQAAMRTTGLLLQGDCAQRAVELTEKRFQRDLYAENKKLFCEMLAGAKSSKAKVVVVSFPMSPCYNEHKNAVNCREGENMLKDLTSAAHVPYYNLSAVDSMDGSYFANADHVNAKGAMSFVMIMDSLLRQDHVVEDFRGMVFQDKPAAP